MADEKKPAPTIIIASFTILAVILWLDPWGAIPTRAAPTALDASWYDPGLPFTPSDGPPKLLRDGRSYTCMECHRHFKSNPATVTPKEEHKDLRFDHGRNNRCYNCHHNEKRDFLVAHDGSPIPYTRVVDLCAKCHGPTYRDWARGVHGRRTGEWNPQTGNEQRAKCTACHNPHSPAFKPLKPAPAPIRGKEKARSIAPTPDATQRSAH